MTAAVAVAAAVAVLAAGAALYGYRGAANLKHERSTQP